MRRKQSKGKRWTAMVLCISMCLAGVSGGNGYDIVKAETQETVGTEGEKPTVREKYMPYIKEMKDGFHQQSNVGKNNYKTWNAPVQSYLQPLEDGAFQRVEGWNEEKKVVIEEYDKNLTKKKLGASGGNAHMIETSAVNKLTIQNCKFYNNTNCKFNNEAIQMESNQNEKSMLAHAKIFTDRDGTTTKNVTIQGCYFQGFRYGCGSNHLSSKDTFTNMKFLNNTFVGATKYAICLYRYKGVKISGNKLKNCGSLYQNQHSTGVSVGK